MNGGMGGIGTLGTGNATSPRYDWGSFNWWGLFLLMIGVAWLGDEMGWFAFDWSMMGPLALVFAGAMAIFTRRR